MFLQITNILFLGVTVLFVVGLIRPSLYKFLSFKITTRKRLTIIFLCTLPVFIISWWFANTSPVYGQETTLYVKNGIDIYESPSADSNIIEFQPKGVYWQFPQKPSGDWLQVYASNNGQGYIKSSELTEEKPETIILQKTGSARECPAFNCKALGQYEKGLKFPIFESDKQGDWYSVQGGDTKDSGKVKVYYLHKSLFDAGVEVSSTKSAPQKYVAPKPETASGKPITLYAQEDVKVYQSQSENSAVIGTVTQGSYWEFPYTPKGDWYLVFTFDKKQGYIKASGVSSEKPKYPEHCSLTLSYRIGRVDGFFGEKGYSDSKLAEIVKYSEKIWEDALDREIFVEDNNSPNTINFIVDPLGAGSANETSHYGRLYPDQVYPNGTIKSFTIKIFSELFTYAAQPSLLYEGNPVSQDKLNEMVLTRVVVHEIGHALGLGHLDNDKITVRTSIMAERGYMTSYLPVLTQDDKTFLSEWCSQKSQ